MRKIIISCLLLLLSVVSFSANSQTLQPALQPLFFQPLTLLPGKLQKLDLPTAIQDVEDYVGILITGDRDLGLEIFQKSTKKTASNREAINLRVLLYTDRGRMLAMKPKTPDPYAISDRAIFLSEVRVGKKESIRKIGLISAKPVTLLKIECFEQFSE